MPGYLRGVPDLLLLPDSPWRARDQAEVTCEYVGIYGMLPTPSLLLPSDFGWLSSYGETGRNPGTVRASREVPGHTGSVSGGSRASSFRRAAQPPIVPPGWVTGPGFCETVRIMISVALGQPARRKGR
jgi:hypothetical protein